MKNLLPSLVLLIGLLPTGIWAQKSANVHAPGVMVYLDAKLEECKKKHASFFRKVDDDGDNGWLAMVYFMDGELKMRGHYIDDELEIPHGEFTYYYQNGKIESKGQFENGAKIGVWERFNPNGSPKAERYYSGYKFGDEPIYDPHVFPEFEGGDAALQKYLSTNLQYPEIAMVNKVEGEVYVTFVINKVGQVTRVMVRNSLDPHIDKEAIRLIENMPNWTPGTKDGNLVNTQMAIPIKFKL
jgi:TonB family protein